MFGSKCFGPCLLGKASYIVASYHLRHSQYKILAVGQDQRLWFVVVAVVEVAAVAVVVVPAVEALVGREQVEFAGSALKARPRFEI